MSENLNICLVNDSFPPEIDGVANAVKNYADIISKKHGKVTVVTPNNPEADDRTFRFPVLRYPSVDLTKLVGYYAGFPFSPEVQRKLVAEKFDLIHSHCPITSTMLARSLRDRIGVPVVMTYHTKFDIDIANAISVKLLQEEEPGGGGEPALSRLRGRLYRHAQRCGFSARPHPRQPCRGSDGWI